MNWRQVFLIFRYWINETGFDFHWLSLIRIGRIYQAFCHKSVTNCPLRQESSRDFRNIFCFGIYEKNSRGKRKSPRQRAHQHRLEKSMLCIIARLQRQAKYFHILSKPTLSA